MAAGGAGTCLFGDCLGKFLAVGPDGMVYPCQRFVGFPAFRLGDAGDLGAVFSGASPAWRLLADRQERVARECGDCVFWDLCRGGCPYNALVAGGGTFQQGLCYPYCRAYRSLFTAILERAAGEFFSAENLGAIVEDPSNAEGLLRAGTLLKRIRSR
jgi:uncharacterized protein